MRTRRLRTLLMTALAAGLVTVGVTGVVPGLATNEVRAAGSTDTSTATSRMAAAARPAAFPIGVWLQDPRRVRDGRTNARNYRDLGVNTFVGLWDWPPDRGQLDALSAAGLQVIAGGQGGDTKALAEARARAGASTRASTGAGILRAYLLFDEPDMNQPNGTAAGGGCVPPERLRREADALRAADPSRPVWVNFGKGMASPAYVAPGCQNDPETLAEYARACDICSVDFYPISDPYEPAERKGIYMVGVALERLRAAAGPHKPAWGFVETTYASADSSARATPAQVRSLVWMQLVHGARGITYFAHTFRREGMTEDGLLADARMRRGVRSINAQLTRLAPALLAPAVPRTLAVSSSARGIPVNATVRDVGDTRYVFAIGGGSATRPGGGRTHATFHLAGTQADEVTVIGEHRRLPVTGGSFGDDFDPYQVHLYVLPRRR